MGPIFGDDIICSLGHHTYAGLGDSFILPEGIKSNSSESRKYLGGSANFTLIDIEVF
jgi:hypothetical protein